jgi:TonB family protein
MGLNQVLTAKDGASAMADLLRPGAVDRDLERALRDAGGITTASDDRLAGLPQGAGAAGRIAEVRDLRPGGGIAAPVDVGPRHERSVPKVSAERPLIEDGKANPTEVARVIRQGLAAIRGCYERGLKRDPRLAGKLILRFTVTPAGTVTHIEIEDDSLGDEEVARCLRALVARWRFPPPQGGPAEIAFPFVFQPSS